MLNLVPAGSRGMIHQLFGIQNARELRGMKGYELEYIAGLGGSACMMGREISRGVRPGAVHGGEGGVPQVGVRRGKNIDTQGG